MNATTNGKATGETKAKAGERAGLILAIGARHYSVEVRGWSADECHLIFLRDLATGQTTRVKDLSNLLGFDSKASCSCSKGVGPRGVTRCRHARALEEVGLLPGLGSFTEGEDD